MLHDVVVEAPIEVTVPVSAVVVILEPEPEPVVQVVDVERMRCGCGMCDMVNMNGLSGNSNWSSDGDESVVLLAVAGMDARVGGLNPVERNVRLVSGGDDDSMTGSIRGGVLVSSCGGSAQ